MDDDPSSTAEISGSGRTDSSAVDVSLSIHGAFVAAEEHPWLHRRLYKVRREQFKGVGFHYTGICSRYYAWRYQKRGSTPIFHAKIARILSKLRNLG